MKKKKGSSILTILIISTALIIVGTVVSSAIMFATQGNANLKINNDLYYAAESGLELGQSNIANIPATVTAIMDGAGADVSIKLLNDFDTNVESVDVKGKKISNDIIELTSIAKKRNSTKTYTLKGTVKKQGGTSINSLYEYSLAANELEVVLAGAGTSADFKVTKVASKKDKINLELWKNYPIQELTFPVVNKEELILNIPNMTNVNKQSEIYVKVPQINGIEGALDTMINTLGVDASGKSNGIKKIIMPLPGAAPWYENRSLNVYIVNADKLYLSKPDANIHLLLSNSIVICSGEIIAVKDSDAYKNNLYGRDVLTNKRTQFSDSSLIYNRATMIANKLTVYGNNFHCTYPLLINNPINVGDKQHGILHTDEEVNALNTILETQMPGWINAGGGVGSGSGSGTWGKVENIVIQ